MLFDLLIYIIAEHSHMQSLEALEILIFMFCLLSKGFKYQEPQSCTECALMDRCYVRYPCSFLLWEAEAGARGTVDSQCVVDIM